VRKVPGFFVSATRQPQLPIPISSTALKYISCNTGRCSQSKDILPNAFNAGTHLSPPSHGEFE
jgi:hypothetical protein